MSKLPKDYQVYKPESEAWFLNTPPDLQYLEKQPLPDCGRCKTQAEHNLYQTLYGNCEHIPTRANK